MITVNIERRSAAESRIVSFAIEGHAGFAKPGKDIVCAGVSAVSVGTVNAIEALAGCELPASMKSGWLRSEIPVGETADSDAKMQLLLESMIVMLESIAASYGKFVVIRQLFRE
jgi:uncharacterized protein YsxB (DUF464 family)